MPVFSVRPIEQVVTESLGTRRVTLAIVGLFAGLALTLAAVGRARESTMRHMMSGKNLGLITLRLNGTGKDFVCLATRHVIEKGSLPRGNYSLFPLFLYGGELKGSQLDLVNESKCRANFGEAFLRKLNPIVQGDEVNAEGIFHCLYAILHSPGYRSRYAEFLKIDFPRVPVTGSLELFRELARLGGDLVSLHLLESPKLDKPITTYVGAANSYVERISFSSDTVWLDKTQTRGFHGIREAVWNFHIGGYQTCEKWLKDRKGRTLSKDDIAHYHKIVVALSETICLMK